MKKYIPYLIFLFLVGGYFIGRKIYFTPNYSSGEIAPNFKGTQPDGRTFELKDLQGNYVLLEFWGSWCTDCRASHPDLVELYKKYHDLKYKDAKNFEIVGVGLETDEGRWKRAIIKDGLIWEYHTSQIAKRSSKMFEQSLAMDYGIRWVPSSFLIDPQGHILKVNPNKKELEKFLSEKIVH